MMLLIYDTLFDYDQNIKIVPWLAEKATTSPDGLSWTLSLQPAAKFSDGSPITADDVKFSLDRMKTSETMKGQLALVKGVEIVDPLTVRIDLTAPNLGLPMALAAPGIAGILSKKAVEASPDYFAVPAVTSGPFVLKEYVPKDSAALEANRFYWNPDLPKVKTIKYVFNSDATARSVAIESGAADVGPVAPADSQRFRNEGKIQIVAPQTFTPLFWGWDWQKPPLDSLLVRQAIATAVDRGGAAQACWFSDESMVTYGAGPLPWDPYYVEIKTYKLDRDAALQKAAALLDQAGWKLGPDGVRVSQGVKGVADGTKFQMKVPYEGTWKAAECNTLLLQQTLKKIGLDIEPQAYERAPYWGDVAKGKFQMYHGGAWAADAVDFFNIWYHSGGSLTAISTHLSDAAVDAKIDAALAAADPQEVKPILEDLQRWAVDNLYVLVWGYQFEQNAVVAGIKGFFGRPDGWAARTLMYATVEK